MTLGRRRIGSMGIIQQLLVLWAFVSFQLLSDVCECDAFQLQPVGSASLRSMKGFPSIEIERKRRPNTHLFARQDGDGDDDKKPGNDLDIFGQPKDAKKRKVEDEGDIRGPDRIKSCIPYILPLIDGDNFGTYIYERIPLLGNLDYVFLRPIVEGFQSVPFLSILLFMTFAIGPQFMSLSREVRFNAQQAVLIDVALIFPTLIGEAVAEADANLPRAIMEPSSNFVWYAYVSMVVYCVVSNLRGKKPDQIPFISGAAEMVIGPY